MLGKVTRILVLKFTNSEVISKRTSRDVESTPSYMHLGLNMDRKNGIYDLFSEFLGRISVVESKAEKDTQFWSSDSKN